eukprot:COSAG01_NODE_3815_length_5671_cov_2.363604_1_plen_79_part_00
MDLWLPVLIAVQHVSNSISLLLSCFCRCICSLYAVRTYAVYADEAHSAVVIAGSDALCKAKGLLQRSCCCGSQCLASS